MNIIAFVGAASPEEDSARFAQLVFDELQKEQHNTEMIFVGKQPPLHCTGCRGCTESGKCVQQDAVNEWKEKLEQADGFIITGDIRNSGLSSIMVALLERFTQMGKATPKFLDGKIGGFGVVGGRAGGMKAIFDVVSFFQHTNAILIWPSYWPFTWNDDTGVHFEECDTEGRYLAGDLGKQMNWALRH